MSTTPVNEMVMPVMKNIQPVNQSKFEMFCLLPQRPLHYIRPHNRRFSWMMMSVIS
jgi:hypothetical protein